MMRSYSHERGPFGTSPTDLVVAHLACAACCPLYARFEEHYQIQ